jgi:hypothetical protein
MPVSTMTDRLFYDCYAYDTCNTYDACHGGEAGPRWTYHTHRTSECAC